MLAYLLSWLKGSLRRWSWVNDANGQVQKEFRIRGEDAHRKKTYAVAPPFQRTQFSSNSSRSTQQFRGNFHISAFSVVRVYSV